MTRRGKTKTLQKMEGFLISPNSSLINLPTTYQSWRAGKKGKRGKYFNLLFDGWGGGDGGENGIDFNITTGNGTISISLAVDHNFDTDC